MQIILISSRTLGASALLLLLFLFSRLVFFLPVVCFPAVVVFEVRFPPRSPPLHLCHSSPSSLLPSGLVVGRVSLGSFIGAPSTRPNPLQMPDPEEGDWELWEELMGVGGGGRVGVLVPLFGISVGYELQPSFLSEVKSGVL